MSSQVNISSVTNKVSVNTTTNEVIVTPVQNDVTIVNGIGIPGYGIAEGGNTDDILVKKSNSSYDTEWTDDITVDSIAYDIAAGVETTAEGQTSWNADSRTLQINKGNGVIQSVTQELNYQPARNTESTALQRGELVMVDPAQPAQGQTLRLKRYISNGTYPVDLFVGMVSEVIQPNSNGFVEWFGQLRNLSLPTLKPAGETWQEGDILWPNPAKAGGMTKVEPSAPAHKVTVAAILRITGNNINLQLRPNLRSRLADLHDFQPSSPQAGHLVTYNGSIYTNSSKQSAGVVSADTTGSKDVYAIWGGTQAEYDAIAVKSATTLYIITA